MSLVRCLMHLSIVKQPIDPIPPRQLSHGSADRAYKSGSAETGLLHTLALPAYTASFKSLLAHILQRRSSYEDVYPFGDQDRIPFRGTDRSVRRVRSVSEQRTAAIP